MKFLLPILLVLSSCDPAYAGLPPTTSKDSSDAGNVTTFNYWFPNFTGTHSGTTFSLGVNGIAGGGTGNTTGYAQGIAGGSSYAIPYQSAANSTAFLSGGNGVLQETAGAPIFTQSPALTNPTANTQQSNDQSTRLATDAYVWNVSSLFMSYVPLNLGSSAGGTYSFASNGSAAVISITSVSSGTVTGVSVTSGGSGFKVGDIIVATSNGGNHDCYLLVTGVSTNAITSLSILYGGTGYSTGTGGSISAAATAPFTFSLIGTLTSNITFLVTSGTYLTAGNQWIFYNNTTGSFTTTVNMSNSSDSPIGTGVLLPQGTNNMLPIFVNTDGQSDVWYGSIPVPTPNSANSILAVNAAGTAYSLQSNITTLVNAANAVGAGLSGDTSGPLNATVVNALQGLALTTPTTTGQIQVYNSTGGLYNTSTPCAIAQGCTGQTTANGSLNALLPAQTGNSGKILGTNGTNTAWQAAGTGTVTNVTFTGDGIFDSSTPSSAVTGTGTVTATPIAQSGNCVFGSPANGSSGNPSCRSLVTADQPAAVGFDAYGAANGFGPAGALIKNSTVNFDTASAYNTSTGVYTAPLSGKWHCTCIMYPYLTVPDQIYGEIWVNGSGYGLGAYSTESVTNNSGVLLVVDQTVVAAASQQIGCVVKTQISAYTNGIYGSHFGCNWVGK